MNADLKLSPDTPGPFFAFTGLDDLSPNAMEKKMIEQKKLLEQDIRALVLVNVMCNLLHSTL